LGCSAPRRGGTGAAQSAAPPKDGAAREGPALTAEGRSRLVEGLVKKHGEGARARIERGVTQVAALWRPSDGDLAAFVSEQLVVDPALLTATRDRLESILEQVNGHMLEVGRALKWSTDVDNGPLLPVDPMLAGLDLGAHVDDDLFKSKVAFVALLNFPATTLAERLAEGAGWSRDQWASVRLAGRFDRRIPAEVQQHIALVGSQADLYIAEYNLWMHHVLSEKGERLFPKGLRLISHWNLRDQLKADYADPKGHEKQRTIARLMERIVTQSIPAAVVNNPRVDWSPFTNEVKPTPAAELEEDAPAAPERSAGPEPDTRYAQWLAQFKAQREADPYSPTAPTAIARSFDVGREIPEGRARKMLVDVVTSPQVKQVAERIGRDLASRAPGRKLEPYDIWYNGFQARGRYTEAELDALTKKRYPTAQAFAADIPRILRDLGFPPARADFIAKHIVVDAARGAGHAMQAARRGDFPHLRTRVGKEGMDYKGYNIAVHELGHNVEQVISLYDVDHTLLAGVPNTAFTEALAFVFQARDLELLGLAKPDPKSESMRVLSDLWAAYEIAGVALLDMDVWHWLYDHPQAGPAELRDAVVAAARRIWSQYYAPVLGGSDTPMLAIYSHLVAYPLYVTDYPIGHLIAFQIERQLDKGGKVGVEFERMAKQGSITPDAWMVGATGAPVGPEALLAAAAKVLGTQTARP
jgi:hypothetical protein